MPRTIPRRTLAGVADLIPSQDFATLDTMWATRLHALGADAVVIQGADRLALWWTRVPQQAGRPLGCIGQVGFTDPAAAATLLAAACNELAARGCVRAIAPIDGSTWQSYRLVLAGEEEPPFVFEPSHDPLCRAALEAAGFRVAHRYRSALGTTATPDPRLPRVRERLALAGVRQRGVDRSRLEAELRAVHGLCLQAFAANVLYTPIDVDGFLAQYLPHAAHLDPDLVRLAEDEQGLCGFVFALPDLLRPARGAALDTLVVKTLAVRPGRTWAGLGAVLVEDVERIARKRGCTRAIHALMHVGNSSTNIGAVATVREYGLWARDLRR